MEANLLSRSAPGWGPQSATPAIRNGSARVGAEPVARLGKNLIDVKSSLDSKGRDGRPIYRTQEPTATAEWPC